MTKQEFISALRKRLSGLPGRELEERLGFYGEMIDDRIEEGLSEEEAVADIGTADEVADQIIGDIPFGRIARERIKPKRPLKVWEIVLLVLTSPIWLSLGVAAVAVAFSLYITLWAVMWAVFASIAACAVGAVGVGIASFIGGSALAGLAAVGAAIFCAGLSIFLFFGCLSATKRTVRLTKRCILSIKKCFIGKEEA